MVLVVENWYFFHNELFSFFRRINSEKIYVVTHSAGLWLPWKATKLEYITSGQSFGDFSEKNLQDCMLRCLSEPDANRECRAITIDSLSPETCLLVTKNIADEGTQIGSLGGYQSFSRPAWYLGKKQPSDIFESLICFQFVFTFSNSKRWPIK